MTVSPKPSFRAPWKWAMLWLAEEVLNGWCQRVDIPACLHWNCSQQPPAELQKKLEEDPCWIICHVRSMTQPVKGLDWTIYLIIPDYSLAVHSECFTLARLQQCMIFTACDLFSFLVLESRQWNIRQNNSQHLSRFAVTKGQRHLSLCVTLTKIIHRIFWTCLLLLLLG